MQGVISHACQPIMLKASFTALEVTVFICVSCSGCNTSLFFLNAGMVDHDMIVVYMFNL